MSDTRPRLTLPVQVAPFRKEDTIEVSVFVRSLLEGEFGLRYLRRDLERIPAEYRLPGIFLVARATEGVVGTVGLKDCPRITGMPPPRRSCEGKPYEPFGMLRRMYVHPTWRGRGLGSYLYQRIEDHARAHGRQGLYLDTDPSMELARRFYRKRGFVDLAEPLVEPGADHDGCLNYMWKPLPHNSL